jgi:23S rRNA (pseudouridine1915-N3)-methyltransferase
MIRIKILSVGKTHEPWLEEGLEMYATRMTPWATFEFLWFKDLAQLEKALASEKHVIFLDPQGHTFESLGFADWFFKEVEKAGSRIAFAIGPAEGFPEYLKKQGTLISLSRLTFTHQLTRLVLMEQLFRAFEIKKGSHYHK